MIFIRNLKNYTLQGKTSVFLLQWGQVLHLFLRIRQAVNKNDIKIKTTIIHFNFIL